MKLIDWIRRDPPAVAFGQNRGGVGNLSAATNGDSVDLITGLSSPVTIPAATPVNAGVMGAADKNKLDGLQNTLVTVDPANFNAQAQVAATDVSDTNIQYLRTAGFTNPGDGGHAVYHRAGAEPSHAYKVQSSDGSWWEGIPDPEGVNIKAFGAVGDGVTDDATAIQNAINYAMRSTAGGAVIFPFHQGEVYAIGTGLTIDPTVAGTVVNHIWLRGTGMPIRFTQGAIRKNRLKWIGATGGVMLTLTNPLDHKLSDIGFDGDNVAAHCIHQTNANGGWGGVHYLNVGMERTAKANFRFSGAVDGGRNIFNGCGFNLKRPLTGTEADDCLVLYDGANNVGDQFVQCEMVYTISGSAEGVAIYHQTGSPQISVRGGFIKAGTAIVNSTGSGGYNALSVTDLYTESTNFFRADKQVSHELSFIAVRHPTGGNGAGKFISIKGNQSGRSLTILGGYTNADFEVTEREDFPINMVGFDFRGQTFSLPGLQGSSTNLIEIGRSRTDGTGAMGFIAASGFITRIPDPESDGVMNVNMTNGAVRYTALSAGTVTIANPANVKDEDNGAVLTIIVRNTSVGTVNMNWQSEYKFAGGIAPSSVDPQSRTIVRFLNMGDGWWEISRAEHVA